jgi:hypothetical protein
MRSEAFDPDLPGRLLDHAPHRPVAQTLPHDLAPLQDRPEQLPFLEAGGRNLVGVRPPPGTTPYRFKLLI